MEFAMDLSSPITSNAQGLSPALSDWVHMKVKVTLPDGVREMCVGDYLGTIVAPSLATPSEVPAVSVFCWDENGEFGDFGGALYNPGKIVGAAGDFGLNTLKATYLLSRSNPQSVVWLADYLESKLPGEWKAEGYGLITYKGGRIVRWIAWESPADAEEADAVYGAISATCRYEENMKTIDAVQAYHLVHRDQSTSNAGAFIVTIAHDQLLASEIMEHAKLGVVKDYLYGCCK